MLTDDDGRQPIAVGHLSDSGDLKNICSCQIVPKFYHNSDLPAE